MDLRYVSVAACCSVLQRVAVCCNVLPCVEVFCNVLQSVAVCCSQICRASRLIPTGKTVTHCYGPQVCQCCSMLHRVAVCCSVLQLDMQSLSSYYYGEDPDPLLWPSGMLVLQCVAASCSVLQRVAACCSVLPCVAVCCRVLPYVAV